MTTMADRIVAVARAEVGVHEEPMGSNTGPRVREYQAATSLGGTGWPWCDAFYTWVNQKAGNPDNPGTASTALTCSIARARGELHAVPRIGAGIIWCGVHVGVVVGMDAECAAAAAKGRAAGLVYTVEGNAGDAVRTETRAVAGAMFVVPKTLGEVLAPPRLWWIVDPGAKYAIRGPWRKRAGAEKTKARLSPALRRRAEIRRAGDGRFVLQIGEPPRRGPFLDEAQARDRLARLERTLGRALELRTTVSHTPHGAPPPPPSGPAQGLGKTT